MKSVLVKLKEINMILRKRYITKRYMIQNIFFKTYISFSSNLKLTTVYRSCRDEDYG